jgi:hypothetical protein
MLEALCGEREGWRTSNPEEVTCSACRRHVNFKDAQGVEGPTPPTLIHFTRGDLTAACADLGGARISRDPGEVTCFACRKSAAFRGAQRQHSIVDDLLGVHTIDPPVKLSGIMAQSPEIARLDRMVRDRDRADRTYYTAPAMNEGGDGTFVFHGTHSDLGGEMEVVPMSTGNVEFTVGDSIFSLAYRDRMNLVRALLHDFRYVKPASSFED